MPWRENEGKANNVNGSTPEDERFIYVYRLAIDARPERVMMWLAENIQACLRDFQTAAASMAHMRHPHLTQGVFIVFVLHPVSASQSVLSVVEQKNLSSGVLPLTLLALPSFSRHGIV